MCVVYPYEIVFKGGMFVNSEENNKINRNNNKKNY